MVLISSTTIFEPFTEPHPAVGIQVIPVPLLAASALRWGRRLAAHGLFAGFSDGAIEVRIPWNAASIVCAGPCMHVADAHQLAAEYLIISARTEVVAVRREVIVAAAVAVVFAETVLIETEGMLEDLKVARGHEQSFGSQCAESNESSMNIVASFISLPCPSDSVSPSFAAVSARGRPPRASTRPVGNAPRWR